MIQIQIPVHINLNWCSITAQPSQSIIIAIVNYWISNIMNVKNNDGRRSIDLNWSSNTPIGLSNVHWTIFVNDYNIVGSLCTENYVHYLMRDYNFWRRSQITVLIYFKKQISYNDIFCLWYSNAILYSNETCGFNWMHLHVRHYFFTLLKFL